jgi:predicted RNA-binding protein with PUA domain
MTNKEIITIIKNTNQELIGKELAQLNGKYTEVGSFQPRNANWCYTAYITDFGAIFVTQFGKICGTKKTNDDKLAKLNKLLDSALDEIVAMLKGNKK